MVLCPPPNVATLREGRRPDDFGRHPGVGAGGAHLGGAVPLSREAKVCDLQSLVAEVFHLDPLQDQDCGDGRERDGGFGWETGACRMAFGLMDEVRGFIGDSSKNVTNTEKNRTGKQNGWEATMEGLKQRRKRRETSESHNNTAERRSEKGCHNESTNQ